MTDSQTTQQARTVTPPRVLLEAPALGVSGAAQGELAKADGIDLKEHHAQFADFHEGYVSRYIAFADTKASLTLGVTSGLIGYLLSKDNLRDILTTPQWDADFVLICVTLALLGLAAICSFAVIAPRFTTSSMKGIVYFGSVANFSKADSFVAEVASRGAGELCNERLQHCFDLSKICKRKYDWLRMSIWLGLPGVISAFVVFLSL